MAKKKKTTKKKTVSKKVTKKSTTKKVAKKSTKKVAKKIASKATTKKSEVKKSAKLVTKTIGSGEINQMIAETAYLRAASRNFQGGSEIEDWIVAENEINKKFSGHKIV